MVHNARVYAVRQYCIYPLLCTVSLFGVLRGGIYLFRIPPRGSLACSCSSFPSSGCREVSQKNRSSLYGLVFRSCCLIPTVLFTFPSRYPLREPGRTVRLEKEGVRQRAHLFLFFWKKWREAFGLGLRYTLQLSALICCGFALHNVDFCLAQKPPHFERKHKFD